MGWNGMRVYFIHINSWLHSNGFSYEFRLVQIMTCQQELHLSLNEMADTQVALWSTFSSTKEHWLKCHGCLFLSFWALVFTERIDALRVLCSDLQVDFVDNNPAFHLQDGFFNEGFLLPDKVHLTRAATNKLVSNLKLELRQGHTTAHTDYRRRGHTPDTPSDIPSDESDASDDDLSAIDAAHPFWQKVVYKSRPRQSKQSGRNPGKQNGQKPHLPSPSQRQPSSAPTTAQRRAPAVMGVHQAWRHSVPGASTRQPKSAIPSRPTPTHPNQRHPHATSNAPTPLMAIQTHPALPQRQRSWPLSTVPWQRSYGCVLHE